MSHISGKRKEAERCFASTCTVNMLNGAASRVPQREVRGAGDEAKWRFIRNWQKGWGGFFLGGGVGFPVKFSDFLDESFPLSFNPSESESVSMVYPSTVSLVSY
jgi:hypothetical protein